MLYIMLRRRQLLKANQLGLFKDEFKGRGTAVTFVGLRPKCYAFKFKPRTGASPSVKKTCKGFKKSYFKHLSFDEFHQALDEGTVIYKNYVGLKSTNHVIRTTRVRKAVLNALDTKRWTMNCGIHTVPFGSTLADPSGRCCFCETPA